MGLNNEVSLIMLDNAFLKELSERISRLLPAAENMRVEIRTKIEQALRSGLSELDVLTQEEFAAQSEALARAEQRIAELEALVGGLEKRLNELETAS